MTNQHASRGQTLTEFALVAPVLFLILFGIIQMGFLFAGQNGLTNAARESARYASTLPTPDTTLAASNATLVFNRLTNVNLEQYVPGYLAGNLDGSTSVQYCREPADGSNYSILVRVDVSYRHPLFIPFVGRLFSSTDTWQLGATEEMRVEGPNRSAASSSGFASC